MTIMTTGFMPCGAKMPIVGLFAGALFGGSWLVAVSAYFIGVGAVIVSGVMLKKFRMFAGEPAPFVMELPAYHAPNLGNVLRGTWGAIGYMCGFAYGIAMIVYQLGGLLTGEAAFSAFTVAALALLAGLLYLLFRPYRESGGVRLNERSAARA